MSNRNMEDKNVNGVGTCCEGPTSWMWPTVLQAGQQLEIIRVLVVVMVEGTRRVPRNEMNRYMVFFKKPWTDREIPVLWEFFVGCGLPNPVSISGK